jgi:hypothetical protein
MGSPQLFRVRIMQLAYSVDVAANDWHSMSAFAATTAPALIVRLVLIQ